ncbi:MAG: hypothetical protein ACRDDM_12805, partial [Paraclostridium sp.]
MADKLIYMINLSFLIADVFCIIACVSKNKVKVTFITCLVFSVNLINFKSLDYLCVISMIFILILILDINNYSFKNDKNKIVKFIGLSILSIIIVIFNSKLKYLNIFINIVASMYILGKSFKQVIDLT